MSYVISSSYKTNSSIMKDVIKLIESHVRRTGIDRHRGLESLLDYLLDMFDMRHFMTADGFCRNIEEARARDGDLFSIALIWMEKVSDTMDMGRSLDFFGGVYEEMYQSKGKASTLGQFFTPESLCECMSRLVYSGHEDTGGRINDCACGSGRTLISHFMASGNMKGYYIGEDIDTMSVKMCALNMMIHGMRGRVVRHDTLRDPIYFDYGFEINEVRYPFPTNFYSVRKISHRKPETIVKPVIKPVIKPVVKPVVMENSHKSTSTQLELF